MHWVHPHGIDPHHFESSLPGCKNCLSMVHCGFIVKIFSGFVAFWGNGKCLLRCTMFAPFETALPEKDFVYHYNNCEARDSSGSPPLLAMNPGAE